MILRKVMQICRIFLDADLVSFPNKSHIRKGIEGIKAGKLRITNSAEFDETKLAEKMSI